MGQKASDFNRFLLILLDFHKQLYPPKKRKVTKRKEKDIDIELDIDIDTGNTLAIDCQSVANRLPKKVRILARKLSRTRTDFSSLITKRKIIRSK